ncbi:MAG: HdeD family acid-resistance protein [Mycobacterium sp.]
MTSSPTLFGHQWKSVIASGLLSVSLGAVMLAWPKPSIVVASTLFGVFLVVSGTEQVVLAFTREAHDPGRALMILSGTLSLILALLAFRHFGTGSAVFVLAVCVGVGLLFQGCAQMVFAISHVDLPSRSWYVFLGLVTAIAGVVVLGWPFRSITVLAVLVGIWLVLVGTLQIMWSLLARRAIRISTTAR